MKDILNNIIKDCYWDYNIDIQKLEDILKTREEQSLKKLFNKIIYNSKDPLLALSIFTKDELKRFFKDFKITYNKKYIDRRCKILKFLLLGEKSYIRGLEWKKR